MDLKSLSGTTIEFKKNSKLQTEATTTLSINQFAQDRFKGLKSVWYKAYFIKCLVNSTNTSLSILGHQTVTTLYDTKSLIPDQRKIRITYENLPTLIENVLDKLHEGLYTGETRENYMMLLNATYQMQPFNMGIVKGVLLSEQQIELIINNKIFVE